MNISRISKLCERVTVKATGSTVTAWLITMTLAAGGISTTAQTTNRLAGTNAAPAATPTTTTTAPASPRLDESTFRIIAERNIFNANRSGGKVQLATRRAARVETFTLVGTMAYQKGAFAFFEGSSSEFSKVLKAEGVIAGHKLVDVLTDGVKLEADGKQFELPIGSGMRREDAGAWLVAEASSSGGSTYTSSRSGDSGSRSSRSSRGGESGNPGSKPAAPATSTTPAVDQSEILKRLMERREKE